MQSRLASITEYIIWFARKYQELQQTQQQEAYRILEVKHNKAGECFLRIQVIGKATVFDATPQEIVSHDSLLEQFSKKDVRTITYFACQEIKKPKYKILIQNFCEAINKITFKLKRYDSVHVIEKTADEISLNEEILNGLSQEDAHMVGHITATEQMLKEKMEMQKLHNNGHENIII